MSNNISGSAASWTKHEEHIVVERSSEIVNYSDVLSELDNLHIMLKAKYEIRPNKNVYDSLISVESAIKALLLN